MTVDYELLFVPEADGSFTPVYRPMLGVRIIGPQAANPPINCRLDTGADDVMVPEIEAGFLGVQLDETRRVPMDSLGHGTTAIFETVDLEINVTHLEPGGHPTGNLTFPRFPVPDRCSRAGYQVWTR